MRTPPTLVGNDCPCLENRPLNPLSSIDVVVYHVFTVRIGAKVFDRYNLPVPKDTDGAARLHLLPDHPYVLSINCVIGAYDAVRTMVEPERTIVKKFRERIMGYNGIAGFSFCLLTAARFLNDNRAPFEKSTGEIIAAQMQEYDR